MLDESILTSIKKLLQIPEECSDYNTDVIIFINSVFPTLNQLGVGPKEGYIIVDENNKWSEFLDNNLLLENVKTYIYLSVRILFDPPTSSSVLEAFNKAIDHLGWRIMVQAEQSKQGG